MNQPQSLNFVPTLPPEEAARADLYGVLARLFATGPDVAVLAAIAAAQADFGADSALAIAWADLQAAAREGDAAAASLEHAETFVGTGRAPVSIYASHSLSDQWKEMTVVELRDRLPLLGLARHVGVFHTPFACSACGAGPGFFPGEAYEAHLHWPLRPEKSRGKTFHRVAREAAGLSDEFIDRLEAIGEG
jgi:hypothetical protein